MFEIITELVTATVAGLEPLQAGDDELEPWMEFAIIAAMCIPVGVVSFKLGLEQYRKSSFVRGTAQVVIEALDEGRAQLSGKARPYETTYDQPFEVGECVYGRWRVRELVPKHRNNQDDDQYTWETIASGRIGDRIVLEDDTGAIVARRPSMTLSDELHTRQTVAEDHVPSGKVGDFLDAQGISKIGNRRRRYEQRVIPPGTDLLVVGYAWPRTDDEDEAVFETLRETYDGFRDDLVIGRDRETRKYDVTDKSEGQLTRHYLLWTMGFGLGGLVFVGLGAVFLFRAIQEYGLL